MMNDKRIKTMEIPERTYCPTCGGETLKPAWVKGAGNDNFGYACKTCGAVYVLYTGGDDGFGIRPASLAK